MIKRSALSQLWERRFSEKGQSLLTLQFNSPIRLPFWLNSEASAQRLEYASRKQAHTVDDKFWAVILSLITYFLSLFLTIIDSNWLTNWLINRLITPFRIIIVLEPIRAKEFTVRKRLKQQGVVHLCHEFLAQKMEHGILTEIYVLRWSDVLAKYYRYSFVLLGDLRLSWGSSRLAPKARYRSIPLLLLFFNRRFSMLCVSAHL